jgi:hypothetical protein
MKFFLKRGLQANKRSLECASRYREQRQIALIICNDKQYLLFNNG